MSDEDERPSISSTRPANDRRLTEIKLRLHALTREKTKYNVDKLNQDGEFLRSEIEYLYREIREINDKIKAQIRQRRILDAERANYKSHSRVHYSNLDTALKEEERLKFEMQKPNKNDAYRQLVTERLQLIAKEKPNLQTLEDYRGRLRTLDDAQQTAQQRRENLEENLKTKLRRQGEIKELLHHSEQRLPEIETEIQSLRAEREQIQSWSQGRKPRRHRLDHLQTKPLDSPDQPVKTLEEHSLEWEQSFHQDRLEKIRQLKKYFVEQMSERNLLHDDFASISSPSSELISPLYERLVSTDEPLSSSSISAEPSTNIAVAMRLPRNFPPLQFPPLSTTNNEILHSPHFPDATIEYKKELPSDILDRYAGVTKKCKATTPTQTPMNNFTKKNKKNKRNSAMKHTPHIITLYNEVRGNDAELLPSMPMFDSELSSTIKSLEIIEQSVQSFLNELNKRFPSTHDDLQENESIRDSALDTFSETSSLIEPISLLKDLSLIRPEQRSSSSSDEKRTIVSSSSPPSSDHSQSKVELSNHLTTVDEFPSLLHQSPSSNQMDRQISDEGYRSVRNDKQQQFNSTNDSIPSLLIRSPTYDLTEKIDLWLSTSPINTTNDQPFPLLTHQPMDEFQGTDFDRDEEKNGEE